MGGIPVNSLFVMAVDRRTLDNPAADFRGYRPDLARRGADKGPLDDAGAAFFVEERDQDLAHAKLGDDGLHIEVRVAPEGLGRRLDGLLVSWGKGAKGVLDAVAELRESLLQGEFAFMDRFFAIILQERGFVGKETDAGLKNEYFFHYLHHKYFTVNFGTELVEVTPTVPRIAIGGRTVEGGGLPFVRRDGAVTQPDWTKVRMSRSAPKHDMPGRPRSRP